MLKAVHNAEPSNEPARGSLFDEIVGHRARRMLAVVLHAEVAGHIEAFADQVDEAGPRLVVRNAHQEPQEAPTAPFFRGAPDGVPSWMTWERRSLEDVCGHRKTAHSR